MRRAGRTIQWQAEWDAWPQENGYFVLRFRGEDVGQGLDEVLQGIRRAVLRRDAAGRGGKGARKAG
ncbi:MAG TPA: hypothetical protein VMN36_11150 [Verrucomicrobiales bacterium]|nr:hypothetical protein [Verrucomicrobiales bacterium]